MTKIKHNNFIDTFNEVLSSVKNKEALYFNNHTYVPELIGMDYKWAKVAYVQTRDNYTMELMNTLQNDYKSIVK